MDSLQPKHCPNCANLNRPIARFCDGCGMPMTSSSHTASDSELKYGSVLFVDIVDSTMMVADRSPEQAREMLLPAIKVMTDAIEAFGGTVNQRLGDGIMALFGVPVSQEDHALRACCASLRMHDVMATLPAPAQLRIGIASGLALFGIGELGAHPAFGATIHLASRLQALAAPGATLLTASTTSLTGGRIRATSLGPHTLRGFTAEQEVFNLDGLEPEGKRFSSTVVRGLSPLVGRAEELAQLAAHVQSISAGKPVRVGLVGEAGVGKSRLAWEFTNQLRAQSWQLIQADAISYGRDIPFQLVSSLLCSAFGIVDRTASDPAASVVRRRLEATGNEKLSAAALLSLLDLPLEEDGPFWTDLQPSQRKQLIDSTVAALLGELFGDQSILVVLEDLQWADEESLRLLDAMLATEGRVMLLATVRPDSANEAGLPWAEEWTEIIHLRQLEFESMVRLLVQAFPAITDPDLRQALIGRSAGNPFFLEELARGAVQTVGEAVAVPPTVQAVVAARIDRLEASAKALLVTASVFGTRIPAWLLRAVAGKRMGVETPLDALVGAGLLQPMSRADNEVTFVHALIQEVAYAGLPHLRCRTIHAQIVRAIKRVDAARLPEMAETLTYHAARGQVWDELIIAASMAGERAAGRSAYTEAARFYHQAIEASAQLRRTPEVVATEVDLRFRLRSAIFPTMAITRSLNNSLIAEGLARSIGDRRRLGWATAYVAKDLQLVGRPGEALHAAARTTAMAAEDPLLLIASRYFAAQAHYSKGDYPETVEAMQEVMARLDATDPGLAIGTPGPTIFFCGIWLTWAEARRGRFDQARRAAQLMHSQAEAADSPLFRTLAALSLGFALAIEGQLDDAEDTLRQSLELSRRWELSAWYMNIAAALGHVLSRRGVFGEGLELLGEAVSRTRSSGILVGHAHELAWQAEAYLQSGQLAAAKECAWEAIDQSVQSEERGNQALARLILGEILSRLGESSPARAALREALTLAEACGMQPIVQRCHAMLGAPARQAK